MASDHKATTVWQGDIKSGSGVITFDSSGAVEPLEVSFPARAEEVHGTTSPEELVAAAHSTCYAMALSSALGGDGHTIEKLETHAAVTFSMEGGPHVSKIALDVTATVPGLADADFQQVAQQVKDACPISKLVAGNVELTVDARLG